MPRSEHLIARRPVANDRRPVANDADSPEALEPDDTTSVPPGRLATAPALAKVLTPRAGIWIGLTLVAVGFAVILVAWGQVAGLTSVAEQMPYIVSGGLTGLGLIICGAVAIDVAVRRHDSRERHEQLMETTRLVREMRAILERHELPPAR